MLKRLFKRLAREEHDYRADGIRAWAEGVPGATLISACEPRSITRIAGVVEGVRVRPREGVQTFEAVRSDGSGMVTAVWLGRRSIPGLTIGSRLVIEGRLGGVPPKLQMMNPTYEFAPSEGDY